MLTETLTPELTPILKGIGELGITGITVIHENHALIFFGEKVKLVKITNNEGQSVASFLGVSEEIEFKRHFIDIKDDKIKLTHMDDNRKKSIFILDKGELFVDPDGKSVGDYFIGKLGVRKDVDDEKKFCLWGSEEWFVGKYGGSVFEKIILRDEDIELKEPGCPVEYVYLEDLVK